ncbi:chorismate-binding protein [Aestuariivivens sediminis]|uniref:chorismate-binding protein n=1 Tax=Aestuariivivens sediminis TaxID=2913557 RepID=UPI001F569C34|nr:chorismate-binding protein [Aestuariivivens sediminis]
MTNTLFFESLKGQLKAKLPFVAYRKPNESGINALLQKTHQLCYTRNFTESGFVFSPFNDIHKTVLIPLVDSEMISFSEFPTGTSKLESTLSLNKQSHVKRRYMALVTTAIQNIKKGKLKKVVLSRSESLELTDSNPLTIFKKLLRAYPKGFVYCWYHPEVGLWLGATPETLIRIKDRQLSVMALAGTQAYKGTVNVIWEQKEKEEQQYVTDFILDRLKASVEHVAVSEAETSKSGNLLHLKSIITGTLNSNGVNMTQLLEALHPTPAVCGVPKHEAKQFILEHENYDREYYTGFLGELNFQTIGMIQSNTKNKENRAFTTQKADTQLFVNLRCMQLKGSRAILYVGGGITKWSNPEHEWDETVAKSMVIKGVL